MVALWPGPPTSARGRSATPVAREERRPANGALQPDAGAGDGGPKLAEGAAGASRQVVSEPGSAATLGHVPVVVVVVVVVVARVLVDSCFRWSSTSSMRRLVGTAGGSAQRMADAHRAAERTHLVRNLPRQLLLVLLLVLGVYVVTPVALDHSGRRLQSAVTLEGAAADAEPSLDAADRRRLAGALAIAAGTGLLGQMRRSRSRPSRSWHGASGERATAADLVGLAGVVALHDRKLPRSRANIDHIAVAPSGVWVIETKQCAERPELHRGSLRYRGRRVSWAEQALGAHAVEAALGALVTELDLPVRAVICVQGASVSGRTVIEGVPILSGRQFRRHIERTAAVLYPPVVHCLVARLEEQLASAA